MGLNRKITDLPELTSPESTDLLVIEDLSADPGARTHKMTVQRILDLLDLTGGWVGTATSDLDMVGNHIVNVPVISASATLTISAVGGVTISNNTTFSAAIQFANGAKISANGDSGLSFKDSANNEMTWDSDQGGFIVNGTGTFTGALTAGDIFANSVILEGGGFDLGGGDLTNGNGLFGVVTATSFNGVTIVPCAGTLDLSGNDSTLQVVSSTTLDGGLFGGGGTLNLGGHSLVASLSGTITALGNAVTGTGSVVLAASPALTGTPTVPTASSVTNSTQAASCAFVQSVVTAATATLWDDRGSYDASGNTYPSSGGSGAAGAILKGDIWTLSVAGTLQGKVRAAGDTVRAIVDTPGQTDANWALAEHSLGYLPLNPANNLSDLTNAATARTNLGLTVLATTTPGTGVATALAINVGSAGAIVVLNGALGTPSSGTLTSCTGLPISTGVSGLGTSVASALGSAAAGTAGGFVRNNGAQPTFSQILFSNGSIALTGSSGNLFVNLTDTVLTNVNTAVVSSKTVKGLAETGFDLTATMSGTITANFANGEVQFGTLSGDVTSLVFTNFPASGTSGTITLRVTGNGTNQFTWPGAVSWGDAGTPTQPFANGKRYYLTFTTLDGGTTIDAVAVGGF